MSNTASLKECVSSTGIRHYAFPDGEATFCGKWVPQPSDKEAVRDCINCARVTQGLYLHNVVLGTNQEMEGGEQHEEGKSVPDG